MVKIIVSLKVVYVFLSIFILLLVIGGIYAWGGITPATLGHTQSELRPSCSGIVYSTGVDNSWDCIPNPPNCIGTNKALHYNPASKTWSCV